MKNQTSGFYLNAAAAVAALVGAVGYLINCGTNYFANLGVDPMIVVCVIGSAVLLGAYVVLAQKEQKLWMDAIPVAVSVLLMVGTLLMVVSRVNSIAAVMTFENNASNMADLVSCIVGIAGCLVATVVSIVAAFHDIRK